MAVVSPENYLDQEELTPFRHMYFSGVVTAMSGGSLAHGTLAMNLAAELRAGLRGRGCRVVGSNVLFRTGSGEMFTYPDVMVLCGSVETMTGRRHVMTNPVFVAEILSPSTEGFDCGAKSSEYRASPSLRQYALLSQDEPWVEIHTRDEAGFWRISDVRGLDGDCEFTGLDCRVPMAALYEGVLTTE
ncbi:MAG: Uma2 family endonuclease [Bryobacteraceae bacterium]